MRSVARWRAPRDSGRGSGTEAEGRTPWLSLLRLVPLGGRGVATVLVTLNLALGLLPIVFIIGTSVMLDRLSAGAAASWSSGSSPVLPAFVVALGALVLQNALTPLQAALGELMTRRIDGHSIRRLMALGMTTAPIATLERPEVLDKLSDARHGVMENDLTPGAAVAGMLALISRYAQLLGAVLVIGIVLGPLAALVVGLTAYVARAANRRSLSRWSEVYGGFVNRRRRMRYVLDKGSEPAAGKDMRMLGILPWFTARAEAESLGWLKPLWRQRRRLYFGPFLLVSCLVLAGAVAVLLQLASAASSGSLSVLEISLAVQSILIPMRFGTFFPESDVQTQFGSSAHRRIDELERQFRQSAAEAAVVHIPQQATELRPQSVIRFRNVSFAYPGSDRDVLTGLTLDLPVGTSTAVVGLNGSGKTTLVKLLAGLYRPTSGAITVDGTDLHTLEPAAWQRELAVIFQNYIRYELDAAANIGLGTGRRTDATGLREAAEWAGAADVIGNLPAGFSTVLSSRYAGGTDLSGGQWQRIALARALGSVGAGASVLVLDEPTAQLDIRAEVAFFDRFLDITQGLTTVVISHRFSSVRRADRIVVLDAGHITETGRHEDLMRRGGQYAELFRVQAQRFGHGDGDEQARSQEGGPR